MTAQIKEKQMNLYMQIADLQTKIHAELTDLRNLRRLKTKSTQSPVMQLRGNVFCDNRHYQTTVDLKGSIYPEEFTMAVKLFRILKLRRIDKYRHQIQALIKRLAQ